MTKNIRFIIFIIADIIVFNVSYLLAFIINGAIVGSEESAGSLPSQYFGMFGRIFVLLIVIKIIVLLIFSVYRILFEYASFGDYKRLVLALATGTAVSVTTAALAGMVPALQPLVILFSLILDIVFVLAVRILYLRILGIPIASGAPDPIQVGRNKIARRRYKRVMIVGSGNAAKELIAEMLHFETKGFRPEIIVDDDKTHEGGSLLGINIVGGRSDIRLLARRHSIDEIIIAKPSAKQWQTALILKECIKTRCEIEMLPVQEKHTIPNDHKASIDDLRKPTISDLLARDMPRINHREVIEQVKGKVVMITGGAGMFGSELCRQIVKYKPRRIVALDVDEDALTILNAQMQPMLKGLSCEFKVIVASVRDERAMRNAFASYNPHIVFHAAELKHIPLAQLCPRETFLTNTVGLINTAELASEYAAEKFVLVSTPRAASQNNVFSACKRLSEVYISTMHGKSKTAFSIVRFPNLINSDANVISIFEDQISKGGPVTVTDKETVRYFMSCREAATLTLTAETLTEGGELFDVGPGEPIEIYTLAESMIRLTGAVPNEDIEVIITERRPGERSSEDTAYSDDNHAEQIAERISLLEDKSSDITSINEIANAAAYETTVENLRRIASIKNSSDDREIVAFLREAFPAYQKTMTKPTIRGVKIVNE